MRTVILTLLVIIILLPLTSPAADKVVVVPLSGNDSLWQKSGAGIFYDSGNVGIGTASPTAILEIHKATNDNFVTMNFSRNDEVKSSIGIAPGVGFGDIPGNAFVVGSVTGTTWTDPLVIENAAPTGAIYIKTNGNVGIETTNPGSKLVVTDLPSGTTDAVVEGSLAGALCITATGNLYIDTDGTCNN